MTFDIFLVIASIFSFWLSVFAYLNAKRAYDLAVKEQLAKRNRRI